MIRYKSSEESVYYMNCQIVDHTVAQLVFIFSNLSVCQAINKLLPLFQKFSMKQHLDVMVVDLKADALCSFSAEVNVRREGSWPARSLLIFTVSETDGRK